MNLKQILWTAFFAGLILGIIIGIALVKFVPDNFYTI